VVGGLGFLDLALILAIRSSFQLRRKRGWQSSNAAKACRPTGAIKGCVPSRNVAQKISSSIHTGMARLMSSGNRSKTSLGR
jgi:hypothetical protein